MTQDRLLEFWETQLTRCGVSLTDKAQAYIFGEEDSLVPGVLTNSKRIYVNYWPNLVEELDGECSEMAKRMLRILAAIRNGGLVDAYSMDHDIRVCARIGIPFQKVLDASFFKFFKRLSGEDIYSLAGLFLSLYFEDASAYAKELLSPGIEKIVTERKQNGEIYLLLDLASILLQGSGSASFHGSAEMTAFVITGDRSEFEPLREPLIRYALRLSGDPVTALLRYSYPLSDQLRNRLKELILKDVSTALYLYRDCMKDCDFREFLKELELPPYPYYMIAAVYDRAEGNKPAFFEKVYQEDPEGLREAFRQISMMNRLEDAVNCLFLLAVMLRHGEGQAELEQLNRRLVEYTRILGRYFDGKTDVADLLRNEDTPVGELAEQVPGIRGNPYYGDANKLLQAYAAVYDHTQIAKRLFSLLFAIGDHTGNDMIQVPIYDCFLIGRRQWLQAPLEQSARLLLDGVISLQKALHLFALASAESYVQYEGITAELTAALVQGHEQEALAYLKESDGFPVGGYVALLDLLYGKCCAADYPFLLSLLKNKSKQIRKKCEELISAHESETRSMLEEMEPKLKGDAAQSAHRIIRLWDNERKFGKDFAFVTNQNTIEFCEDNLDKNAERALKWLPDELFQGVRFADLTEEAPAVVLKFILSEYLSSENPYRIRSCDKVVDRLCPSDFENALEGMLRYWTDQGAEAKRKMLLVPYCIYGSDSQVIHMRRQIEQWADASRGALAAFAVKAVALNGGSVALMMVDNMAVKFPNNQVKNAARTAFAFVAEALEISEDELSDRIVPNLGFDQNGERVLDYGPRTFTISLQPDFSLAITDDAKGKTVKSIPKPAASDDPVKAEAAKKEFSELKKQIKAVVQTQTGRLDKVLMNGRQWDSGRWKELFVENPIMHRFATGLIWGVYQDGVPTDTFRYMDDGTFNTVDEEEFELPENAMISLVHPVELEQETLEAWRQQLEDYEVIQPVAQLEMRTPTLSDEDLSGKQVTRYSGKNVTAGRLTGVSKKYSMIRGEVLDGGSYTCFHLVDKYLNVGVQINFEWMYMGEDYGENVPMQNLLFYSVRENGVQDDIKDSWILDPKTLPKRFISSVLAILDALFDM